MSKFVFHLETLLRHRHHLEKERQRDLAAVLGEMSRLDDDLAAMNETLRLALSDLRDNRLIGRLDLHFLSAHRRYTIATQRKAHAIAQEMAQVRRRVDEARSALAEAAKQRKMLEKLREKHKERWSADQARREFAELDDLGTRLAFANLAVSGSDAPEGMAVDGENAS